MANKNRFGYLLYTLELYILTTSHILRNLLKYTPDESKTQCGSTRRDLGWLCGFPSAHLMAIAAPTIAACI